MAETSGPQYDAAIIGGGIIGCAIGWKLAAAGMRVVVIERGRPGAEASHAAGGMLAPLAEADHPDAFFQLCVASREMYAAFAGDLREAGGIDIEYRDEGTLYLALTDEDEEELERRWTWQHDAGLNVKRLDAGCVGKLEPALNENLRWALKFPDDHQVNNRQLGVALQRAALDSGVNFLTSTEARKICIESRAGIESVTGVEIWSGIIPAKWVVLAAGCWSGLIPLGNELTAGGNRIEPVRGQMLAVEMPPDALRHVIYSRRGYLIPRLGGFLIAGTTSEHAGFDKSVTPGGLAQIISHAAEILPSLNELAVIETWAGLRPSSADELPLLGRAPDIEGLIYATGHYRNGILLAPITALAISELILNGDSRIDLSPFSPGRFAPRRAGG